MGELETFHVSAAMQCSIITVFIRLNAALDQRPHIRAKLTINAPPRINAAPDPKNAAFSR